MVLVDSDVWSEAIRKKKGKESWQVSRLKELILHDNVEMLGPIRQEILSGIREKEKFTRIAELLDPYPDGVLTKEIHILAASLYNVCRSKGIQGSHIDFMNCAFCIENQMSILSKDKDYSFYAKLIPINLITK